MYVLCMVCIVIHPLYPLKSVGAIGGFNNKWVVTFFSTDVRYDLKSPYFPYLCCKYRSDLNCTANCSKSLVNCRMVVSTGRSDYYIIVNKKIAPNKWWGRGEDL